METLNGCSRASVLGNAYRLMNYHHLCATNDGTLGWIGSARVIKNWTESHELEGKSTYSFGGEDMGETTLKT